MTRIERLSDTVTLYLGDSREILPTLSRPAAIISDPPYGQRNNNNVLAKGGIIELADGTRVRPQKGRHGGFATVWPDGIIGDDGPFDPSHLIAAADIVLLWGAHWFGERLPRGSTLVWDKVPTGKLRDQGDGELAWLNVDPPRPLRIFRLLWDGLCVGTGARHEVGNGQKRVHPTQKPEALLAWCITQARVPTGGVICDPYMGAGSTGVAAVRAGHGFVGMELEPLYFDTACRRIAAELSVGRMDFGMPAARPPVPVPAPLSLFEDAAG